MPVYCGVENKETDQVGDFAHSLDRGNPKEIPILRG